MTAEITNSNNIDKEKIDIFKHIINEAIEDPKSSYSDSILKLVKVTCDVIFGKKNIEKVSESHYFYVEFLVNHKEFFTQFKDKEITKELIEPHYVEILNIFNSWKTQSQIIDDLKDKYLRLFADFENYKRRAVKDKVDYQTELKVKMNKDIISIIDDLNIAKSNLSDEAKSGVDIIFTKLESYLSSLSIQRVQINKGDVFNSDVAECIATIPSGDFKDGQVIDILKNAWSVDGKVVRFGQVVVCKN